MMKNRWKITIVLVMVLVLVCSARLMAGSDDFSIEAAFNSDSMTVGQVGRLTVVFTGKRKAEIDVAEVDGLVIDRRGQQSMINVINGSVTSSYKVTFHVQAEKAGDYVLDQITATVGGKEYRAEPITMHVKGVSASGQVQNRAAKNRVLSTDDTLLQNMDELFFLQFIPEKQTGYVGENIPVSIKAYFRVDLEQIDVPVLVSEGFTLSALSRKPQQTRERVNGAVYNVFSWQSSLAGVKEGRFTAGFDLQAILLLKLAQPQKSRRNMDPFDSMFMDDFFRSSSYTRKSVSVHSEPVEMEIHSLPLKNRPDDFTGAIGDFDFHVEADPVDIGVGDPVSLKLTITGTGNFDRVQCPTFPDKHNFKVYPENGEMVGLQKQFERAVIVKNGTVKAIPAHTFSYFDPKKEDYVTLTSDSIPLHLEKNMEVSSPVGGVTGGSEKKSQMILDQKGDDKGKLTSKDIERTQLIADAAPQKMMSGTMVKEIKPLFQRTWYVVAVSLMLAVFLAAVCGALYRMWRKRDKNYASRKEFKRIIQPELHNLEKHRAEQNQQKILACCRQIIKQYCGFIWKVEADAITLADLMERLDHESSAVIIFKEAEENRYSRMDVQSDDNSIEREKHLDSLIRMVKEEL